MKNFEPQSKPMSCAAPRLPFRRFFNVEGPESVECWNRIRKGEYHIFLATPPAITSHYLEQLARCPVPLFIWVEKPWFPSLAVGRRLEGVLSNSPHRICYGDHYLHRAVCEEFLWQAPLEFLVGGPVAAVEGILFEKPAALSPAMVTTGVMHDLLIHDVSLVSRLFPGGHLEVTHAFASRVKGWPGSSESYASLRGVIDTGWTKVPVSLTAGKYHPVARKQLVLQGPKASLLLDFMQESADLILPGGFRRRLYPDSTTVVQHERPYAFILRTIIEGRGEALGLDLHSALDVLRALDDAKRMMPRPLPIYDN